MHIVQLIDLLKIGGAQKLLVTFAETIRQEDIRLTVISLHHEEETPMANALRELGVEVLTFPARKMIDPRRIWRLSRYLRHEGVDTLYTHLTSANVAGTVAGWLAGVPVVATLHNTQGGHPRRAKIESWLLRLGTHKVVAVGHAVKRANQKRLGNKTIEVVPNAVAVPPALSNEGRRDLRASITGDPARPLLLSVGRLTEQKGFHDLLQALAEVVKHHPSLFLAIAGQGGLWDDLAAQIQTLGLEDHVALLGARNDVPQLMVASDLFVSSSHWEGLPVALLEAMAAGLPIVATRVGDVPHVLVAGTGRLVPPREPQQLAEAIGHLLDDSDQRERLGATARAHAMTHYSATAWAQRLLAFSEARQKQTSPSRPQETP